jgi:2-desacetyl-2-hydroxyethyl bacteriochlorophyllide A dehydrogenase
MRAIVCSEPGKLVLEERREPIRREGDISVRVRRVGICGTDYHIYEGKHPYLKYPRVMGHELAVEIIEAPAGSDFVTGEICVVNPYLHCGHCVACRAGKTNCCVNISVLGVHQDGGMTEMLSLRATSLIHARGLTADQCATAEFLAIGAHAVRRGSVSPGEKVLVVGAGPIGLGVALFARLSGGVVALLDRDTARLKVVEFVSDIATLSPDAEIVGAVHDFTNGDGFDVVFDATGNAQSIEKGFDFVAHGGRYVLVSVVLETIAFADPDFHRKEMSLFGSRNATDEDFERVIAAIRDGQVPVNRLITHRTSLDGAMRDLPRWASEKSGLIKALIAIG